MAGATHLLGRSVGRYVIESVIGSGGFATVYRATDTGLERPVALKVVDPSAHRNPTVARRFVLEGQAVASLNHPAIVPVYDAGEQDGVLWLAMRLVEGSSLGHALASGRRFAPDETVAVVDRIGAALDHAHAHGIVHRDVKPSNILLEDNDPGRAWLADFGIATTARTAGLYTTGALGTAAYMAPEQSRPSEVGPPADLYSLACVAYEMVTGHRPYPGEDYVALLLAHATAPVPPIGRPALDALMARALAKQPANRPASGRALAQELRKALAAEPSALPPQSPVPLRVAAAGAVPTVVDEARRTLVYPQAAGAGAVAAPGAGRSAPPPGQAYRPPSPPYGQQYRPPAGPLPGFHPAGLPPRPPVSYPTPGSATATVARTSRRRGRQFVLAGLLVLLVGGMGVAAALVQLERDRVQRVTDSAGLRYEVPAGWSHQTDPPTVIWSDGGGEVARLTHTATSQTDAGEALQNREPAVCPAVASGFEVRGADAAARCDNSEGSPVAAVAALAGGELWIITVEQAVPKDQREDFLASLDFT